MSPDDALLPGRLLRRSGPPRRIDRFTGVETHDARLAAVRSPEAPDGTRLGFGPTPEVASHRAFHPDGSRLYVAAASRLLAFELIA